MGNRLLIKNGLVVFPETVQKKDILISNNKIQKTGERLQANVPVLDAKNRYILPGGVDVHTHMGLKVSTGALSSDSYKNGSKAALLGGITTFFGFAYQNKGESLYHTWLRESKKAQESYCDHKLHTGIRYSGVDLEDQIAYSALKGNRSFKVHLNDPSVDSVFLLRIFRILSKYNSMAFLHCEDGKIIEFLTRECKKKRKAGIRNYPSIREDYIEKAAVDQVINLARRYRTKIYIAHLSSEKALKSVSEARAAGFASLEAETCVHYLFFTDNIYKKKNGFLYTCSPSFKKKTDQEALWKGLKDGVIQVVSSDHCPFMKRDKIRGKNDFTRIPLGIPGIETLYPIMLSEGRKRNFRIQQIVKWISANPAKIFNMYPQKGVIKPGVSADLVIYNPKIVYRINHKNLGTNCDYSPYEGLKVQGKIEQVLLRGKVVVRNNELQM